MAETEDIAPPSTTAGPASGKRSAEWWLNAIQQSERDRADWFKRAKRIERIYLDERDEANRFKSQYALLWANISVLQPAVYAKPPSPVVTRRFSDRDPVARGVSEVMERSLTTIFDHADIDTCMKGVRDNFLIVSQGTAWVRYVPSFETQEFEVEPGRVEAVDVIADETLGFDFVHWADFLMPKGRRWEDLPWVGRRVYLDDSDGIARFGKKVWDAVKAAQTQPRDESGRFTPKDQTCIYEIWSKRDREVIWVAKGYAENVLDRKPPLYELAGFYPCPKPAFGTLPTDNLNPIPDYVYYQDQAGEINNLTARIGALQDVLKLVGFYPAGGEGGISTAIETALSPDTDNKMIPVPSWAAFTQGGGSKGNIEWLPVEQVVTVLMTCVELRGKLIDDVFQITGISDIIRGSTDPRETRGAQQIKAQWGSIRIRDRQAELARFARDLTRIAAEIVAEKFQPETLWRLSGLQFPSEAEKEQVQAQLQQMQMLMQRQAQMAQQAPQGAQPGMPGQPMPAQAPAPPQMPPLPPQIKEMMDKPTQEDLIGLMRDDRLRSYRIDIETDSTIEADEQAEKASRQEFVTVLGTMLAQALPVAQQAPELVPIIGESLLFLTRAYRAGRQLEDTIEQAVEAITAKAKAAVEQPQQPPPDPRMEKVKLDEKLGTAKLQLQAKESSDRLQFDREKAQAELTQEQREFEADVILERQRLATQAADRAARAVSTFEQPNAMRAL